MTFPRKNSTSLLLVTVVINCFGIFFPVQASNTNGQKTPDDDTFERPFLTRDITVYGTQLPITPITVILFLLSALILFGNLTKPPTATASHILIDDHSDGTRDKLMKMKQEIGRDPDKFAKYAAQYSKCPSGKSSGGSLGTFGMGSMVPPFEKAVFDPKNKVGDVVGPVETQFGWHLILVHERTE